MSSSQRLKLSRVRYGFRGLSLLDVNIIHKKRAKRDCNHQTCVVQAVLPLGKILQQCCFSRSCQEDDCGEGNFAHNCHKSLTERFMGCGTVEYKLSRLSGSEGLQRAGQPSADVYYGRNCFFT
jgi:hypothetical protein